MIFYKLYYLEIIVYKKENGMLRVANISTEPIRRLNTVKINEEIKEKD
jgi:hypothetical protein